ncbi:MAG: ABC transporter permease, partial [Clostridiaceae bacterium]|nr:ABC transporter permease [Clostridiaceae bacterium]
MTLIKHELKQSRVSLAVWMLSIASLLAVCVFLYPEMKGEMDSVGDMFASMGSFTEAFGMDK